MQAYNFITQKKGKGSRKFIFRSKFHFGRRHYQFHYGAQAKQRKYTTDKPKASAKFMYIN